MSPLTSLPSVLRWDAESAPLPAGGLQNLAPWSGSSVEIEVAPEQVALLLEDHEVVGVLMPQLHTVHVAETGDAWRSLPSNELARRMGSDDDAVSSEVGRVRVFSAEHQILFLSLAPQPTAEWGGTPMPVRDGRGGQARLNVRGRCRVRVGDPLLFYESFLRHTEALAGQDFRTITSTLVHESFARALDRLGLDLPSLPEVPQALAAAALEPVHDGLVQAGLWLEELEVDALDRDGHDVPERATTRPIIA